MPGAVGHFRRAKATAALSDIQAIELALTTMLADSGRSSLKHLFDEDHFRTFIGHTGGHLTAAQMAAAQTVYTRTFNALLREGRATLDSQRVDTELQRDYAYFFKADVVKKLGSGYLDLAKDPWGEKFYQIWPGPLSRPQRSGNVVNFPVPFRVYEQEEEDLPGSIQGFDDGLILEVTDQELSEDVEIGFPASTKLTAYIYSYGENLLSGQAIPEYLATGSSEQRGAGTQITWIAPGLDSNREYFYDIQEPDLMGGGDDVNNWDKGQSWGRFYR